MAKKELRRAVRDGQSAKDQKPAGPTIKGAVLKGLLLSSIYLLLVRVLLKSSGRPFISDLVWAIIFFVLYTVFIFLWDRWLFRRRQRRQQAGK